MRQRQRRLMIGFFFAAAAPLVVASVAFACQRITPIHASPGSGAAGTVVRVTGVNFSSDGTSSNVEIRWDRRDGPSLASIAPSALGEKGSFDVNVTVPGDAAIGNHILIATQTLANGAPCVGCPGRSNFEVRAAAATAQASSNSAAVAVPASGQDDYAPSAAATAPAATAQAATAQAASQPVTQPPAQQTAATPQPVTEPAATAPAPAAPVARPQQASPAATPAAPAAAVPAASPVAPAAVSPSSEVAPAPPAAAPAPASAPAPGFDLVGRSSASGDSPVPGLTLVAGLVLVLLGLAAFVRSGGGRGVLDSSGAFTPAA